MGEQGSFFDAAETPLRPRETVCPACNGSLDSPAERREGRCRRCIASGARALTLADVTDMAAYKMNPDRYPNATKARRGDNLRRRPR